MAFYADAVELSSKTASEKIGTSATSLILRLNPGISTGHTAPLFQRCADLGCRLCALFLTTVPVMSGSVKDLFERAISRELYLVTDVSTRYDYGCEVQHYVADAPNLYPLPLPLEFIYKGTSC